MAHTRWLRVHEAADYLGVSVKTIRNWTANGILQSYRFQGSNRLLYKEEELENSIQPVEPTYPEHLKDRAKGLI